MRLICRWSVLIAGLVCSTFFIAGHALAASATATEWVQKAYIAYYGRPGDLAGVEYWAGRLDSSGGNLSSIIDAFGNSQEFTDNYGSLSNDQLIITIYQQMFNRDPDAAGKQYYLGQLNSGAMTLQSITLNVLGGAQNADLSIIQNKLAVAAYFTSQLELTGATYKTISEAQELLSLVDETAVSVESVKSQCDVLLESWGTNNNTGNQEFDRNTAVATDPLYGFRSETPDSTLIPASMDYSAKMPSVKSQGSTSSCTSWATGYYYKTYQESIEEGWDRNQNSFSPMFLYSLQCRNYAQPWSFIAAWETLNQYGCAKYATMPFVDLSGSDEKSDYKNVTISNAATTEARNYRCGERNQLEGLNQVKQALTRGPVLLGINKYSNLHLSSNWHPSPENNYITQDASNSNVGHAILCVGYEDSKFGTGALKFINSWGQDWAIDGFSWLRYSDYSNIVLFAMSIQDIPNANRPDNTTSSPAAPSDVAATDDAGPYVDITWSTVTGAQYYRIFRAKTSDSTTYSEIGTAYQGSFRDNPEAGVTFFYSVVSYNDVGNSAHYASDTDAKGYVDKGSARGSAMSAPVLSWLSNDNASIRSNFSVSNLASNASSMEVLVASSSAGPWHSFGWASPGNFYISWGQNSEYIGKKPFVKIVVSSSSGTSGASNAVQVGQTLVSSVNVAAVTSLQASAQSNGLRLNWSTNGGGADFFEIWRWLAAEDEGNEWIMIDYADSSATSYTDTTALPGKSYYYAVAAVYQGTYGEFAITDEAASLVTTQANLFLYEVVYEVGEIYNPANFQLTVWNDGGTTINDYSILIYVYDWDDGQIYYPFDTVYASDYTSSSLPPGYSHTLSLSLNIPSAYADGHYYSWIIEVDYDEDISELYEDDNWIITEDGWWAYYLSSAARKDPMSADSFSSMDSTGTGMASSRPFSKKRIENMLNGASKDATLKMLNLNNRGDEATPIRFKKPSFCVDHDK